MWQLGENEQKRHQVSKYEMYEKYGMELMNKVSWKRIKMYHGLIDSCKRIKKNTKYKILQNTA